MNKAVFFDRDGVLDRLVLNPKTGEYESPHAVQDLELLPGVGAALRPLQDAGFRLFLISNQPSYAKGKTTLENIRAIHEKFHRLLLAEGVQFTEYYYCYHHPAGVVPEYSGECSCRKPKPYFIFQARDRYALDLSASWLIGDQDTDIECGRAGGLKTVMIAEPRSQKKRGSSRPDFYAPDLAAAAIIVRDHST
jgi:D-glycero-D-manno-heptose 1,7-bisphosphate phosphatase